MQLTRVPTLHLLCGKIAAGKSTLARALAVRPSTLLIIEDNWIFTLFSAKLRTIDDYEQCSERLRAAIGPHIVGILQQGISIVLDFPANTITNRSWMRSLITQSGADNQLHLIDVPDSICKQRLRKRNAAGGHLFQISEEDYDRCAIYFEPPQADEGFNIVAHRQLTESGS